MNYFYNNMVAGISKTKIRNKSSHFYVIDTTFRATDLNFPLFLAKNLYKAAKNIVTLEKR
jgi:hypothetical protein